MIFNLDIVMKNTTVVLDSNYPEDATVIAGQDVTFKAVITDEGHPKEYTLQWYVNGTAIEDATGETYTRNTSSDKGVLSVWCEATNRAGTATSRRATLTVKRLPVLNESYPQNVSVTVAKSGTFEVKISKAGYPSSYTYQWYVNDKAVSGATKASYTRTAPSTGTEKIFCKVTNEAGTIQSRTATLTTEKEYVMKAGKFVTGGTNAHADSPNSIVYTVWSIDTEAMRVYGDGTGGTYAWSSVPFDFTGKNRLCFYTRCSDRHEGTTDSTFYFGAAQTGADMNFTAFTHVAAADMDRWIYSVDVSHLTGMHYIKVAIARNSYYFDYVDVMDIYFE